MFDPSIYENLKVVAEGAVYDLDLDGEILVTNRKDQVDLAKLSRFYAIAFRKADKGENSVHGEFRIYVDIYDLSSEIMEKEDQSIGCYIEIVFFATIHNPEEECETITRTLQSVWGNRPSITQTISYVYEHNRPNEWFDTISLKFDRKIGEAQIEDLPIIVDTIVESIDHLNELL